MIQGAYKQLDKRSDRSGKNRYQLKTAIQYHDLNEGKGLKTQIRKTKLTSKIPQCKDRSPLDESNRLLKYKNRFSILKIQESSIVSPSVMDHQTNTLDMKKKIENKQTQNKRGIRLLKTSTTITDI